MMKRLIALLIATLAWCGGCVQGIPVVPIPGPPPAPGPVTPQARLALEKWNAVSMGMTEAEVTAVAGPPSVRNIVGSGMLAAGWWVEFPDTGVHYVEIVYGLDSKVASKVVW